MAISKVQEARDFSFGSASFSFGSNVTSGNLIIVHIITASTTGAVTVSDTRSNSYTQIQSTLVGGYGAISSFYCIANATGSCTVTFARSGGFSSPAVQGTEWSGQAASSPLDASATNTGSSTSPNCSVTATGAADLIYAMCIPAGSTTIQPDTGWTRSSGATPTNYSSIYGIETASGSFTPQFVQSFTGGWGVIAAAFKAAAGAAPSAKPVICIMQ